METMWFALRVWALVHAWWRKHSRLILHESGKSEGTTQKQGQELPLLDR